MMQKNCAKIMLESSKIATETSYQDSSKIGKLPSRGIIMKVSDTLSHSHHTTKNIKILHKVNPDVLKCKFFKEVLFQFDLFNVETEKLSII